MKRLLGVAALALACAAPALAGVPVVNGGSSVGEGLPLKAYATITPTVHLFGDSITAKLAIVADTKWVDPSRLQVNADFAPYEEMHAPTVQRLGVGRFAQVTWIWTLHCVRSACVPRVPPSDRFHVFQFHAAHIAYLEANNKPAYGLNASWPPIEVLSQISPGLVAFLDRTNRLNWQLGMTPVAAPTYRLSPTLLLWLAIAVAAAFGIAAIWFGSRWYLVVRPQPAPDAATVGAADEGSL